MIRLGVNTWLWANRFEEKHLFCIDRAKELGAEAVDFSVNDPYSFPVGAAAAKMEGTGMASIVTTAMAGHCNAISPEAWERKAARDYMHRLIDIAAEMKSPLVGGVTYAGSGYHSGKERSPEEIARAVEYLKDAAQYAAQFGIDVCMEPVKRFETHFLNTAQQALELIELTGAPNVKVHLDTFHMNIEEASIPEAIRSCGDKLAYLHFVENNRDTPGRGHIPWKEIFEALRDIGFDGAGCIETFNPQTLEETGPLTYLMRRFADTPEELAQEGLTFLKGIRREVCGY